MKCACCKTELVKGEMLRLETLDEHIGNPNGPISLKQSFVCPNQPCAAAIAGVVWNDDGDAYRTYGNDIPWIDGNYNAFGSFSRQQFVESSDEDYLWFTFPCWPWKGWECHRICHRRANEDGEIVSRHWSRRWITPDHCWYTSGRHMLWFCTKRIWRSWWRLRKNGNQWDRNELEGYLEKEQWPRAEWWRKVAAKLARLALRFS